MFQIRKSNDRGYADHGWLKSFHTFSFGSYRDPKHMGFRSLRVINEDRVSPGEGFGTHSHENMEIVSYVLEGQLQHRDSMGNGEVLTPGEFQRITAGTGIQHSEFNASSSELVHFYQIWLIPSERGLPPSYQQKRFPDDELDGKLRLVASPDAADNSITIHVDARIYLCRLKAGESVTHPFIEGRNSWLQILRGAVVLDDQNLTAGDAAVITSEASLTCVAESDSEIMLFDLA